MTKPTPQAAPEPRSGTKKQNTLHPEARAVQRILSELNGLSDRAQGRVLRHVGEIIADREPEATGEMAVITETLPKE